MTPPPLPFASISTSRGGGTPPPPSFTPISTQGGTPLPPLFASISTLRGGRTPPLPSFSPISEGNPSTTLVHPDLDARRRDDSSASIHLNFNIPPHSPLARTRDRGVYHPSICRITTTRPLMPTSPPSAHPPSQSATPTTIVANTANANTKVTAKMNPPLHLPRFDVRTPLTFPATSIRIFDVSIDFICKLLLYYIHY